MREYWAQIFGGSMSRFRKAGRRMRANASHCIHPVALHKFRTVGKKGEGLGIAWSVALHKFRTVGKKGEGLGIAWSVALHNDDYGRFISRT